MENKIKKSGLSTAGLTSANPAVFRLIILLVLWLPVSALAKGVLSAKEAYVLADQQKIILVDIRSEKEWKETGLARDARPISMHGPQFLSRFQAVRKEANGRPIALICATGGRSAWLQKELSRRGINNIVDVAEGMLGSDAGPGWLRAGLPVVPYKARPELSNQGEDAWWERITGSYKPLWLGDK